MMNPNTTELMQAFVVSHGDARFESGLAEGSTNGLLVGLLVSALIIGGLVLLGASRSSVERNLSVRLGAISERTPQERPPTSPVPYQKPMSVSSDLIWRG
jgi:hypothetical protein